MTARTQLWTIAFLMTLAGSAVAQVTPQHGRVSGNGVPQQYPSTQPMAGPQQPLPPQTRPLPQGPQQRPAPQQPQPGPSQVAPRQPMAPFQLTAHQEAELNRALKVWEQSSSQVKTFECGFHRFTYDPTFGRPDQPLVDKGELKYSSPDKGSFKIEGPRAEHWICDGVSIFEYKFKDKQLVEHRLPPELRGKAIADGPIPFIFGANAEKLKQRYFLRLTTPAEKHGQEIWLEAYPRYQQDAANFQKADLILTVKNMQPFAVQVYKPGGVQREVYQFESIEVNQKDLLRFLKGDPFMARLPGMDWKHVVEEAPVATEARRR